MVYHLPSGKKVGEIIYHCSVEEIYDVQIFPGKLRPNILNTEREDYKLGLSIPKTTFWAKDKVQSI